MMYKNRLILLVGLLTAMCSYGAHPQALELTGSGVFSDLIKIATPVWYAAELKTQQQSNGIEHIIFTVGKAQQLKAGKQQQEIGDLVLQQANSIVEYDKLKAQYQQAFKQQDAFLIDICNKRAKKLFFRAACKGNMAMLRVLCDHFHVDPNMQEEDTNMTALMYLVQEGREQEAIKWMQTYDQMFDVKNQECKTVYQLAREAGNDIIADALKKQRRHQAIKIMQAFFKW